MASLFRRFQWTLLLGMAGLMSFGAMIIVAIRTFSPEEIIIQAPGETILEMEQPGMYAIWHHTRTVVDGTFKTYPEELPEGMTIEVTRLSDGTKIPLHSSGSTTMESNGTKRIKIAEFEVAQTGQHRVQVTGFHEPRSFHVTKGGMFGFILLFLGLGLLGAGFLMATMVAGVIGLIRCMEHSSDNAAACQPVV